MQGPPLVYPSLSFTVTLPHFWKKRPCARKDRGEVELRASASKEAKNKLGADTRLMLDGRFVRLSRAPIGGGMRC